MKKILCAVLALAAMASCSKEYIVAENKQAIAFGEAFVENGTRADYSTGNVIEKFKVYGTLTGNSNTVQIFKGADVNKPSGTYYDPVDGYDSTIAWLCDVTQYWVPNASYEFAAIVDGVAETTSTLPEKIKFTVADGDANKDLLYATATATTTPDGTPSVDLVAFTFNHLLSKVQFTVANNMATGYSIEVTSITVDNVVDKGIYDVNAGTWAEDSPTADTTSLTFGTTGVIASANSAVASATRQILPVQQELAVTVVYNIYYNDGNGDNGGEDKLISTATKTGTIPAQIYAKNTVYNITAEIDANRIEFTVDSVNGFGNTVADDVEIGRASCRERVLIPV